MRILGSSFSNLWEGRMINIHPSILPRYKGLHTHKRVLENRDKIHGCSVHYVTGEIDGGPVIAQSIIRTEVEDTENTLASKVLQKEHKLYPHILSLIYQGVIQYERGKVYYKGRELDIPLQFSFERREDIELYQDLTTKPWTYYATGKPR